MIGHVGAQAARTEEAVSCCDPPEICDANGNMSRDNFFWSGLSRTHYYLIVAQLQRQSLISENIYLKHTMVESENGDIPFEWLSGDLINWLKQLPGANINPKIQLVDLRSRGAGRGVGSIP